MNFFSIMANHLSLGRAKLWLMATLIKLGILFWLKNVNISESSDSVVSGLVSMLLCGNS